MELDTKSQIARATLSSLTVVVSLFFLSVQVPDQRCGLEYA
jgi:hypothetical protein